MKQQPITLEDIQRRKQKLRKQIVLKQKNIKEWSNSMLAPVPVRNKFELGYRWFSNTLAIYDGVKMGWKIIRYITRK